MYNPLFQSNLSYSVVCSFRKNISLSLLGSKNRKRPQFFGINLKDKYCILSNLYIPTCLNYCEMYLQVKKLKADIYTHTPRHRRLFFSKIFFPSREVCRERKLWPKNWLLYDLSPYQEKKPFAPISWLLKRKEGACSSLHK